MSCTQAKIFSPSVKLGVPYRSLSRSSHFRPSYLNVSAIPNCKNAQAFPRLVCSPSKYKKFDIVCSAKGGLMSENKGSSWDPLKKSMEGKEQERGVPGLAREQIRNQMIGGKGGDGSLIDGGGINRGGGGRTGGGGGGGSGGEGDENFAAMLDEMLQMILATIGFIFVYVYLIRGAELTRLARDYVKFILGGTATVRLTRAMDKWESFCVRFIRMEVLKEDWVEQGIVSASTWWQKPKELVELLRCRDYMKKIL